MVFDFVSPVKLKLLNELKGLKMIREGQVKLRGFQIWRCFEKGNNQGIRISLCKTNKFQTTTTKAG